jgi:glutathione peroxidase-family protein
MRWTAALLSFLVALALAFLLGAVNGRSANAQDVSRALPPFTQSASGAWINSAPLRVEELRGQVLLVDVWTFECWNCYRSFPWLTAMEKRFAGQPFRVIGIHSPEFEREKSRAAIVAKTREFGLEHPIMIDNDHAYWRALDNSYWPAYYVVDKEGRIRARFVGETHADSAQAHAIEQAIKALL